jgi:hypothetical protein
MNKRGQSLILFVLILPLISLFIAFFIDSTLSLLEKNKIDGIITSNMREALNKDIHDSEKIKKAIKKNEDIDVIVTVTDSELKVVAESKKESIFGKLLKFNYYDLKYNYCANYVTKDINKKCG